MINETATHRGASSCVQRGWRLTAGKSQSATGEDLRPSLGDLLPSVLDRAFKGEREDPKGLSR